MQVSAFTVPFSIVKPVGWITNDYGRAADIFALQADQTERRAVGFSVLPTSGSSAAAVASIRAAHGYIVGPPVPARVGSVPATRLDVRIDPRAVPVGTPPGTDISGSFPLFLVAGGGSAGLYVGDSGRVYVADVHGKPVIVLIEAPSDEFGRFVMQGEGVLATVRF